MPTYDYVCDECGHTFEKFQMMSASPLKKCPECGKMKLKRLIGTGAGIIFKGSGFYETDYRSDNYRKCKSSDSAASASTPSPSPAKTESAPKAKKESKPSEKKTA